MKKLLLALLLTFGAFYTSFAQNTCGVVGYAHSIIALPGGAEMSLPVTGYEAVLVSNSDTLRFKSTNGDFHFRDLKPGKVTLSIKKTGYTPFQSSFELTEGDQTVVVELIPAGEELEGAVAKADAPVMRMKGDTLIYNANAFQKMEGDYAIDILMQMPGVEVTDMGIKVAGKDVSRAYVNGVLIFGRRPMDAVNNLAATQVEEIKVYDEETLSESTGNPIRQRVMNIITKNKIIDVTDVQMALAGGADAEKTVDGKLQERHLVGVSGNFFSQEMQIKSEVLMENLGNENVFYSGVLRTPSTHTDSRSRNNSVKLSIEKYLGQATQMQDAIFAEYNYSGKRNSNVKKSATDYFEIPNSVSRAVLDSAANSSYIQSQSLGTTYQKNLPGDIFAIWSNNLSLSRNSNTNLSIRSTSFGNHAPILENSNNMGSGNSWNVSEGVALRLRDKLINKVSFKFSADKNKTNGWTIDTLQSSTNRRYLERSGDGVNWNVGGNINILKQKHPYYFTATLSSQYTFRKSEQVGLDFLSGKPETDMLNTFDYTHSLLSNSLELRMYATKRLLNNIIPGGLIPNLSLTSSVSTLIDNNIGNSSVPGIRKNYFSLLPSFHISMMDMGSFNISLDSSAGIPSLEQVRDRIDNLNVMFATAGNPDLKASTTYNLSINKWTQNSTKGSATIRLNASLTSLPIVRKQYFYPTATVMEKYHGYVMPAGSTLNTFDNADWAGKLGLNLNLSNYAGGFRPATLTFNGRAETSISPEYLGNTMYRRLESSVHASSGIQFSIGSKFRTNISAQGGATRSVSNASDMVLSTVNWGGNVQTNYKPTKILTIQSIYSNNSYLKIGDSKPLSTNFLKLSCGFSLLGNSLQILAEGIDLLNNNRTYSEIMTSNSFTRTFNTTYGKYFLLTLQYRFNTSQNRYFMSSIMNAL